MDSASVKLKKVSKAEWYLLAILICVAIFSWHSAVAVTSGDGLVHVYFLDVGQGDSQLIEFNGNQILIDGGPDGKVIEELSRLMPISDRTIELVILTHPDADHINGMIEVLERYQVNNIIENFLDSHDSAVYRKWNNLKKEALVLQAEYGQRVDLGSGVNLEIIYPLNREKEQSATNNNSIISRLVYGENSILFTGDTEAKVEKELAIRGIDMDADFLKVPHHGSKTSSTNELLDAASPEVAFVQVGADNRYGHPHPSVLQRFNERDIKYYRNDINGAIELVLDGLNYKIETER